MILKKTILTHSIYTLQGVMVRLMLVLAPVACILAGIGISSVLATYMKVTNIEFSDIRKKIIHLLRRYSNLAFLAIVHWKGMCCNQQINIKCLVISLICLWLRPLPTRIIVRRVELRLSDTFIFYYFRILILVAHNQHKNKPQVEKENIKVTHRTQSRMRLLLSWLLLLLSSLSHTHSIARGSPQKPTLLPLLCCLPNKTTVPELSLMTSAKLIIG